MGLPLGHPESPPPEVHAQTVVAEPCPLSGEPEGLEEVAYAQPVPTEPDLRGSQPDDPNVDTRTHLEGAEPEDLLGAEGDWLLEVEEGTAEMAAVEENMGPRKDLLDSGISHLATLKANKSLTFPSSPSPATLEAAGMQHAPVVDTGTPAIRPSDVLGAVMAMATLHHIKPAHRTDHYYRQVPA